jgi:hypothetical protein
MFKAPIFGIFLLCIGLFLLARNIFDLDIPFWDVAFPILLIVWGASMLINNLSKAAHSRKAKTP